MTNNPHVDSLFQGSLDDWLLALPEYQGTAIREMLEHGKSPEEAAIAWLSATGPANTAPFGAHFDRSAFFDKLLREIEKLVCGDEDYEKERNELLGEIDAKQAYLVGFIAASLAPAVGAAAPLLAPAIALVAFTIGKMGIKSWCAMRVDIRKAETSSEPPNLEN